MPHRIAVYPGSFDPPTYGHVDIIKRATQLFESVIVAVARNDEKDCLFTVEERIDMLKTIAEDVPGIKITSFSGLTTDFARKENAVAIVRGLRAVSDYEYELSMATTNKKLNPDTDTVLLTSSERYMFLSSRVVKEIAKFKGDRSHFVPPEIEKRIRDKMMSG